MAEIAGPGVRPRFSGAAVNFAPRLVGGGFLVLIVICVAFDRFTAAHWGLALIGLAWPHVALLHAKRAADGWRAERINVLFDCFFFGLLAAVVAFRILPVTAVTIMALFNTLMYGGMRFLLLGLVPIAAGVLAGAGIFGWDFQLDSEPAVLWTSAAGIVFYVAFIGSTAHRLRARQRETREALKAEERKSQALLENVFPCAVIPRLRTGESPIADQFADVTVIFADLVGFTPLSERLGPRRTVMLLNDLFGRFDTAAKMFGVEKIETTGDGYLAVGGAPGLLDNHPEAVARLGLAILQAAESVGASDKETVQVRVGIHTGPVFAGVVGESRFHYKIFGETVNVASRVQSQSLPGSALVSESTFKRISGLFNLKEHGTVELKGHGPMRTYWLLP